MTRSMSARSTSSGCARCWPACRCRGCSAGGSCWPSTPHPGCARTPRPRQRLFCHVYGRTRETDQLLPAWPYQLVAALESGPTSWTALLDAIRLGPAEDATAVTADQLRAVV